jgi:2-oxoisovalerate dehydrogenase E1 component
MRLEERARAPDSHRLTVDDADLLREPVVHLRWMAQVLLLIRAFEEKLLELKAQNLVNGPVHTSIGQEAVAVGVARALRRTDKVAGTHRAHHQYLAKAFSSLVAEGSDPLDGLPGEAGEAVRVLLSEVMGLRDGCCGGRGGSMHLCNPAFGVAGTNAIVGGGIPMATGAAWADLRSERDKLTVCFFGDGALYQGTLHEAANLAALWKIPIIYFIENNCYAVGTSRRESCSAPELDDVAAAYGMPSLQVDGMDPLAVSAAVSHARDTRQLPCFIEAATWRHFHHAGGTPGSAYGYRSKEEEAAWLARDPVAVFPARLRKIGALDENGEQRLRAQAAECVSRAAAACTESKGGILIVSERCWPDPSTLEDGLRNDAALRSLPRSRFGEAADTRCPRTVTYVDAIAEVTGRWLEQDPRVVVLGEEVANFGGGAYGATKGLPARFPGRVINTPISEAGFTGLACGAAMNGMRPVVEIMFSSFALVAADQLFNQAGQLGHIYGGNVSVPLVARTRVAIGLGYGAQHSMDPAGLFTLFPGWRVVAPSTAFDYIGLFNAAMLSDSPTIIIEHQELYGRNFPVPDGAPDHLLMPGTASVVRTGKHVTIVGYSITVSQALEAARELEAEGIDAEVIDLRTLDAAGIDYGTLGESVAKTGTLVFAEQAPACSSIGPRIAAECVRRFFGSFDGPPSFVAAPSVPMPVSRRLELACIPSVADIVAAARGAARRT